MAITLGLDVSTSITGVAIFEDGELLETLSIKTTNKKLFPDPVAVAFEIKRVFKTLKYKPDKVYIEESLQGFARGKSSANTIITLAQINGLVCFIVEELYGIKPVKISAKKARKACGVVIPKKTPRNEAKRIVLDFVNKRLDNFEFEYTIFENPRAESFDRADAVIIALAGMNENSN